MSPTQPIPSACRYGAPCRSGSWRWASAALLLALLVGCASTPTPVVRTPIPAAIGPVGTDGPSANPPADLLQVPDAEPRVEIIRASGPNKPYEVLGQHYTPVARDDALAESGLASWYGRKFHGRPTASGEIYDMHAMTAAHRTMPIPSYARVRNPANGREVVVRINDRGPFHRDRIIDLSYTAALKLGVLSGVAPVEVQRLTHEDIRLGRWRGDGAVPAALAVAPATDLPATARATPPPLARSPGIGTPPVEAQAESSPAARAESLPTQTAAARGFWLQFGAFSQHQGAFDLRQQLMREFDWIEPLLAVFVEHSRYRVQAGPYASRGDAQAAADRIRQAMPRQPLLLQRR